MGAPAGPGDRRSVSTQAAAALARTVNLIANDVFDRGPGEDPSLEAAIVEGLRTTTIRLVADGANLSSYAGQTALVSLFGLLAMMGLRIDLDIPEIDVLGPQPPLHEDELRSALLAYGGDLIPDACIGKGIGTPDLTFVLGNAPAPKGHPILRVTGDAWRCLVAPGPSQDQWMGSWPLGALAGAGAAAAEGFRAALRRISEVAGQPLPRRPGLALDIDRAVRLDLSNTGLREEPLPLGDVDFVSGGAITTSALYCLVRIPGLSGRLRIIEPDRVDLHNLNRYPLMRRSDCGRLKGDVLAKISSDRMSVTGVPARFDAESTARIGALSRRVLVGVDDIPSRWAVQRAANGWVCVAGTSHFYALVTTHRPGDPCAGCAHPRDDDLVAPIPTISFVSFWAGLMQARALLIDAAHAQPPSAGLHVWPSGLYAPRALHRTGVAPRVDCPVECIASRTVA